MIDSAIFEIGDFIEQLELVAKSESDALRKAREYIKKKSF